MEAISGVLNEGIKQRIIQIIAIIDESPGDLDNLPDPDVLAGEIIESIEAGLSSFKEVANGLNGETEH